MEYNKYAAIDIGSNAIRLQVSDVIEEKNKDAFFLKDSFTRVPIRLGQDAFTKGKISDTNSRKLIESMKAFRLLMQANDVIKYRGVATSALRSARNGKKIVAQIREQAEINIDLIDGATEAKIIYQAGLRDHINNKGAYLFVDVGGGSTEMSLFVNKKHVISRSFKIGTVRLLNNQINDADWAKMKQWIKNNVKKMDDVTIMGSGGNIKRLFKLMNAGKDKSVNYMSLLNIYRDIDAMSMHSRITVMGLKPDRADVITHAGALFLSIMKWSNSNQIFVPTIGISNGIITSLYDNDEYANYL